MELTRDELEAVRRIVLRAFSGRKGHGGGGCTYRQLRPRQLAFLLASVFIEVERVHDQRGTDTEA